MARVCAQLIGERMRYNVLLSFLILGLVLAAGVQAQQAPPTPTYDVVVPATRAAAPYDVQPAITVTLQERRSRRWEGAAVGALLFAAGARLFLYSGDSTSLCNRERNQDAIGRTECSALVAGSAVVGAGTGYILGSRIRVRGR
jgi:hypothetical protein